MKCPGCGHPESTVCDSRVSGEGQRIRRRRECLLCAKRYTTYEITEDTLHSMKWRLPSNVLRRLRQMKSYLSGFMTVVDLEIKELKDAFPELEQLVESEVELPDLNSSAAGQPKSDKQ